MFKGSVGSHLLVRSSLPLHR